MDTRTQESEQRHSVASNSMLRQRHPQTSSEAWRDHVTDQSEHQRSHASATNVPRSPNNVGADVACLTVSTTAAGVHSNAVASDVAANVDNEAAERGAATNNASWTGSGMSTNGAAVGGDTSVPNYGEPAPERTMQSGAETSLAMPRVRSSMAASSTSTPAAPLPPAPSAPPPQPVANVRYRRHMDAERNRMNNIGVRSRVALGAFMVLFGTLAVVGLIVNGYRSSMPYASILAFFTLAVCAKFFFNDPAWGAMRVEYMHRRYHNTRGGVNMGGFVSSERVQYSRLNQRLALMDRDFTPADYELLLELDHNSQRFRRFLEGASKDAIDRLPTYTYKLEEREQEARNSAQKFKDTSETKCGCTICLEFFENDEAVRILPCFHQFHVPCVDRWLLQQAKCPVCKLQIINNNELSEFPES